jgi:hypothetical protein
MSDGERQFEQELLIEKMANLFMFDKLSEKLPGRDIYPPYLFLGFFLFVGVGVVGGYEHFFTEYSYSNPFVLAGPVALIIAIIGIRYMSKAYLNVLESLPVDKNTNTEPLNEIISIRTKVVVYVIAILTVYATILFIGISNIIENTSPVGNASPAQFIINYLIVWEIGYIPFVVEFGLIYLGIHFFIPRRIKKADLNLFYYDPRNMGGFGSVGQLLKRSYYLYTAGLLLFFVLVYGGFIIPTIEPAFGLGMIPFLFFSGAWLLGVISIGYSMLTMHRIMSKKKEKRIREIEEEIREIIDNPHDINSSEVTDKEQFEDLNRRLEHVKDTREYPATVTMWSQIAISVLLPQVLQVVVQVTL